MKHPGSILNFTAHRNEALLNAFLIHVSAVPFIRLDEIGKKVVNSPSPRFWVSERRARDVVSAIMKGGMVLNRMRPSKREMYEEIHCRVMASIAQDPSRPLSHIIHEIVNSPAPKFYMKPSSAIEMLFKIRKLHFRAVAKTKI